MRNAFVVLVSLCIGLASGFIVPSGGLELLDDNHAILADNDGKESEEAKGDAFQEETGFIVLPFRTNNKNKFDLETKPNHIKDKELYEQDTTKHNNVNERSFIYINQKFKTPVVNQLYSSQDLIRDTFNPVVSNVDETNYNRYPGKYTSGYSMSKPKNEYFEANIKRAETKNLYFPPSGQYNQEVSKALANENKHSFSPNKPVNKLTEEQNEYVELLKPPILRPVFASDKKENRLWTLADQSSKYQSSYKNIHVPSLAIDPRQFSMSYYDNYGFPTPYGNQRSLPQLSNKHDELSKVTDSSVKKVINENNNVEVNKLLDRYLKDSLEDQVTNERMNLKKNNCNYSNCVLKSTKQFLSNRIKGDTECKCGRRLNVLKQRESTGFEDKETNTDKASTVKTETNSINITPRSSESSDYGDLLTEEMNLKKLVEE